MEPNRANGTETCNSNFHFQEKSVWCVVGSLNSVERNKILDQGFPSRSLFFRFCLCLLPPSLFPFPFPPFNSGFWSALSLFPSIHQPIYRYCIVTRGNPETQTTKQKHHSLSNQPSTSVPQNPDRDEPSINLGLKGLDSKRRLFTLRPSGFLFFSIRPLTITRQHSLSLKLTSWTFLPLCAAAAPFLS